MVKKTEKHGKERLWRIPAAMTAVLLLLLCLESALVQKGVIGIRQMGFGCIVSCLIAGLSGLAAGKGEGRFGPRLLAAATPAAALLILRAVISSDAALSGATFAHAGLLVLPTLLSAVGKARRRKRRPKAKKSLYAAVP